MKVVLRVLIMVVETAERRDIMMVDMKAHLKV